MSMRAPSAAEASRRRVERATTCTRALGAASTSRPMRSVVRVALGLRTDFPLYQFREPSNKPFITPPRRFFVDGPPPSEGTQPHDETETPPDIEPEDILSGPLVDVPDAVRGHLREPSRRRSRGERAQRPHGHDLGTRRQGGPSPGLVPPRRIRRPDARGMAGPGRADTRPLARGAEALPLSAGPPHVSTPRRHGEGGVGPFKFGRGEETA